MIAANTIDNVQLGQKKNSFFFFFKATYIDEYVNKNKIKLLFILTFC